MTRPRAISPTLVLAVCAAVVIAVGVALRLWGFASIELWGDEALWGARVSDGSDGWIRPVGFMAATRLLLSIENSEAFMRGLSIGAGIAQLPLLFLLLRRIAAAPFVALLGTWLLAINTIAVTMSKEFKPYAFESTYHTVLVLVTVLALEKRGRGWLLAFIAVALAGIYFAWSSVFAFPAAFAVLFFDRWGKKLRADAALLVAAGALTILEIGAIFLLRISNNVRNTEYWGDKYDVFFVGHGLAAHLGWILQRTADIATYPVRFALEWKLTAALHAGAIVVCALGVISLIVARRWQLLALLAGPWLVALVFNCAGQWPYGSFRTNTFLIFYSLTLTCLAIDALWGWARARGLRAQMVVAAALIAVLVATFPWNVKAFGRKPTMSSVKRALTRMMDEELLEPSNLDDGAKVRLFLGGRGCSVARYYLYWNTDGKTRLRPWFDENVDITCSPDLDPGSWGDFLREAGGRPFWALSAKGGFDRVTKRVLQERCAVPFTSMDPKRTFLALCIPDDGAPEVATSGYALEP